MEWLASLPVYLWSDLRDALGGPLRATTALVVLGSGGWLATKVISVYIASWSRRLELRDTKLKRALEATEAQLMDCTRRNRALEERVSALEVEVESERSNCRKELAKHEREIYELRSTVLDLKGAVVSLQQQRSSDAS